MKLSVCIPSIPSRFNWACALFNKIDLQSTDLPVEILMLTDNKQRSVGHKRQALLDLAQGEYVCFVDDDDDVSEDYIESLLSKIESGADVITFETDCEVNGLRSIVRSSVTNPNQQFKPDSVTLRKPIQVHAWRRELAVKAKFPDSSFGEDFDWAKQIWHLVRNEVNIPRVLHYYRQGSWSETQ